MDKMEFKAHKDYRVLQAHKDYKVFKVQLEFKEFKEQLVPMEFRVLLVFKVQLEKSPLLDHLLSHLKEWLITWTEI
jgi:hypothetical protein